MASLFLDDACINSLLHLLCLWGLMQDIPEPCFFLRAPAAFPCVWCLWGLMQGIAEPCFMKASSNSLLLMSLRACARHPWTLFFKGRLQQFFICYAFQVLCKASQNLAFLRTPAAIYAFGVSCKASLNLFCLRMPAAIPYCLSLWGLMQGIPEPCFW